MVRFYTTPASIIGNALKVNGESFHYLKNVLCVRKDENVSAFDGTGREYLCIVDRIHSRCMDLRVVQVVNVNREPSVEICLVQSVIKARHFDFVVQKCTELGVKQFVPVITDRTVVRLKGKRAENRRLRWEKVAVEAARQCGRSFYPGIDPVIGFGDALAKVSDQDISIIPWEEETSLSLREMLQGNTARKVMVFIGPEGGFREEEVFLAKKSGVIPVSLGKRLLRSETAAIATVAVLVHALG